MNIHPRKLASGEVVWRLEVHVNGKRRVSTVGPFTGKDQGRRTAEAKWHKFRAQVEEDAKAFLDPSRETLAQYLPRWLASQTDLKPTTVRCYEDMIRLHLLPKLGTVRLQNLSPDRVEAVWRDMEGRGRLRSALLARAVLRKALQDAVRLGALERNPVDRTKAPRQPKRRVQFFTVEEVDAILRHATPRWKPLIQFAAHSGLRIGEILGLCWGDVKLDEGILSVRRNVVTVGGKNIVQESTKTGAGVRSLTLPTAALDALRAHLKHEKEVTSATPVFATDDGGYLMARNVTRAFSKARDAAGVKKLPFHSLRHFAVTVQIAAGVPLPIISKRIGHATISMTADLYGHLLPQADRAAADAVDKYLTAQAGGRSD